DVTAEDLVEVEETLTTEDVDNAINTQSISCIDDISNDGDRGAIALNENTTPDTSAPLATTTKNELVANTANSLGIELSTTEIDHIADNFDNSSDDFSQTLEQVKLAIISYVQHKVQLNNQQITDTINEIGDVIADGFNQ
ncbi:MAG: hypothetical protein ACKPB9_14075, partial [Dolichospermum sp.]